MNNILKASRHMGLENNLCIRILDADTGEVVQEHISHNTATNSMLTGIAHYLTGDGILNQGEYMLSEYVPKYISLGTMGLINQNSDKDGLPAGIGDEIPELKNNKLYDDLMKALQAALDQLVEAEEALERVDCPAIKLLKKYYPYIEDLRNRYNSDSYPKIVWPKIPDEYASFLEEVRAVAYDYSHCKLCQHCWSMIGKAQDDLIKAKEKYDAIYDALINYLEEERFASYLSHCPGYGSDGYDEFLINGRKHFGLGPVFADRSDTSASIDCELISDSFPREDISFRDIVPEVEAELPKTIDVVFSAMISTGALKQFRETGRNYIFITECGLWSKKYWEDSGDNGLLAGYRIIPSNEWRREVVAKNLTNNCIRNYLITKGIPDPSDADIRSFINDEVSYFSSKFTTVKTILDDNGDIRLAVSDIDPSTVDPSEVVWRVPVTDDDYKLWIGLEELDQNNCEGLARENRKYIKTQILKVGINQVVQVIWKIQLGSIDEFADISSIRKHYYDLTTDQGNLDYVEVVNKLSSIRNKYKYIYGADSDETTLGKIFNLINELPSRMEDIGG